MPDHIAIATADAIVTDFNAATWSQQITAVRKFFARYTLEELKTVRVTVVPKDAPRSRSARGLFERDVVIDIALQKLMAATDAAAEDTEAKALAYLSGELLGYYEERSPTGTGLAFVDGGYAVLWDPDHFNEKQVFTSVMTITLRKWS